MSRTDPRGYWTAEQEAYLFANLGASPLELKPGLDERGPARSVEAIKSRRRDARAGVVRVPDGQAEAARKRLATLGGWPSVAACPIEQDRNFLRALFRDMQREGMA